MSYLLNNVDLYNTYSIRASHIPGSNIAVKSCFDMPKRIGTTHKDWGDSDGVEPWVTADEIMFAGRDIEFSGFMLGTVSELNTNMQTFYDAVNAATGISTFETPYNSASGYIKSVTPEYMNGGCTVKMIFREPAVTLTGTLPASGTNAYTIDSIPFASFGLYLSKAESLYNLPECKEQYFTKYGQEGYQIVKRKNKTLDINGFVVGSSLSDFMSKIQALYKVFSSSGTRSIVLNTITTVVCFATEGFTIDKVHYYDSGVIAKFNTSLMVKSVTYYTAPASYPSALANRLFWFDPSDSSTITGFGGTATRVNDKLGNGNDLVTGSCTSVDNTLLFDGISQYLKTGAIPAMVQPTMIYMIVKQVTWTANDRIFSGITNGYGELMQSPGTPSLRINAGTLLGNDLNLILDTWAVLRVKFDGASSSIQVNDNAPLVGDAGLLDMGGFVLGARGDALIQFSNIQAKDVIAMPGAESETEIYNWLVTRL